MKYQIGGVYLAQFAAAAQGAKLLDSCDETIGEINAEEQIGGTSSVNHAPGLGG